MGIASYSSHDFELHFPNISLSLDDYQRSVPFTNHRIYLPILYGILFVTGIVGNAWVVYVIACVRWFGGSRLFASNQAYFLATNSQLQTAPCCHRPVARRTSAPPQNQVHRTSVSAVTRSRTARNVQIYIMCLCCCDLIVLLFLLFLISDLIVGQWPLRSTFLCRAYLASESVNKFCVPFLLVALSGYCYTTVAQCDKSTPSTISNKPTGTTATTVVCKSVSSYRNLINFTSPLASAFICVCTGFCLVAPVYLYSGIEYFISYNETTDQVRWVKSKCGFRPPDTVFTLFSLYSFICGYILPSILFTCFYASVLRVVYKRARRSTNESDPRRVPVPRMHRLSSVAKTTLGLVVFYQLCWIPYWSMNLYQYLHGYLYGGSRHSAVGVDLAYFVHVLPYINCTGYPIVYTFMNKNIKETYHRIRENRRQIRRESSLYMEEPCPCRRDNIGCCQIYLAPARYDDAGDYRRKIVATDSLSERQEAEVRNGNSANDGGGTPFSCSS